MAVRIGVQDDLGRARHGKITQRHSAADRAVEAGRERTGEPQVLLPGRCAVYGAGQGQAARAVNAPAVAGQRYRAVPGVGSAGVAQRAPIIARAVQGQGLARDAVGPGGEVEFQRAAIVYGRAAGGIAERARVLNFQRARVYGGLAAVGVGGREGHGTPVSLCQAHAGAAREDGVDRAILKVVIAAAEGEGAFDRAVLVPAAVGNRAVEQLHAAKGVIPAREIKGPVIDNQRAVFVDGVVLAEFQRAAFHPGVARVGVGSAQRERARAGLAQAARAGLDVALDADVARARDDEVAGGGVAAVEADIAAQYQGLRKTLDSGVARERNRAVPGVVGQGVQIAQRARQPQDLTGGNAQIAGAARQCQGRAAGYSGPAIGGCPPRRAQRVVVLHAQRAVVDVDRAREGVVAAHGQDAGVRIHAALRDAA